MARFISRKARVAAEMNRRLGGKWNFTGYDNLCVRRIYRINETKPEY